MLIAISTRAGTADAGAQPPKVLFEQPAIDDLARSFVVPLADPLHPTPPPADRFGLVLWQPNPKRSDGTLVPTSWTAGDKTGFYPTPPLGHQLGFDDRYGATTVQAQGGVVGAYLNAQEVSPTTDFGKLMITPQFRWSDASAPRPFSDPAQSLLVSLELQVPAASDARRAGSLAYIVADLEFMDRVSGTQLSYGSKLFFNGHGDSDSVDITFDAPSRSILINAPDEDGSPTLVQVPGSDHFTGTPWRGWRTFSYAVTRRAFSFGLDQVRDRYPNANASQDPADYRLTMFHLNAEVQHSGGPAELGWSMRNARINLQDGGS
ncbi:hypothetical protein AWB91_09390 [Mycobacterium paraense]|uniref:Uncharacterized protein n=1 Tax=Mycobacterium paraense TaxID=767916 RepID=A0ABX3VSH3_9MYCO|nr:hypothetical protein [Mycobacterium paraense]ORW33323.1 hypothetical protein AWB91_09390 [Mycobacterium paraense]ORW34616.1 hypothetical protein AWB88_02385 [Mycobacterium paraense]